MNREAMERAMRRSRGRAIIADWSSALSKACGLDIRALSFLDPDITAEVNREFISVLRQNQTTTTRLFWPKHAKNDVVAHLLNTSQRVTGMQVVLFSSVDEFIGGVELPAELVLRNAEAVWKVVDADLSVVTRDFAHGMCLEESQYASDGEYIRDGIYEMTAWGRFE